MSDDKFEAVKNALYNLANDGTKNEKSARACILETVNSTSNFFGQGRPFKYES